MCVGLPCLFGLLAAPASAEPIADWLGLVTTQCSNAKPLRLGVIGFEPGTLPLAAAESVRLSIQTELSKRTGVETAAVRDAELLRGLQEDVLGRVPPAEIAGQLRDAFLRVDALVFFKGLVRTENGDRVRFRLLALLPDKLGCAPPSEEIERPLPATRALEDLDTRLAKAVQNLMDARPPVTEVTVCPFENVSEKFSTCAPVLTDLVLQHLDKERRSRSAILTNRTLSLKRAEQGRCAAADVAAIGKVEADRDGKRLWMKLEFQRVDGQILAPVDRTQIFPQDIGCDARLLSFFDYVRDGARLAEPKLSMRTTKQRFARGDLLGIDIKAGTDLSLYCWILAEDRTAFMALPIPGHEDHARIATGRSLRYPGRDFDTDAIRLQNRSEDLFGCFGSERPLPVELHNSWMSLTGPRGKEIEVKRDDVLRLLEMMRAQPGIVEAFAPVIVR